MPSNSLNVPHFQQERDSSCVTAPQSTSLQSFEKAWAATGQFAAFIRPRRKP